VKKIYILFLISHLGLFSPLVNAQGPALVEANFEWLVNNYHEITNVLKTGTTEEAVPLINTLGNIWRFKDGAIGIEVSDLIALSLIHHTKLTLSWFQKHPKAYSSWLNEMPNVLFTDYAGGKVDELYKTKESLLIILSNYQFSNIEVKLEALADEMTNVIKPIEVREIE